MALISRIRGRSASGGGAVLVGASLGLLLLVTSISRLLYEADDELIAERFQAAATHRATQVSRHLRMQVDKLAPAQRLFAADQPPNANAFQAFAQRLLDERNIFLLAWLPATTADPDFQELLEITSAKLFFKSMEGKATFTGKPCAYSVMVAKYKFFMGGCLKAGGNTEGSTKARVSCTARSGRKLKKMTASFSSIFATGWLLPPRVGSQITVGFIISS